MTCIWPSSGSVDITCSASSTEESRSTTRVGTQLLQSQWPSILPREWSIRSVRPMCWMVSVASEEMQFNSLRNAGFVLLLIWIHSRSSMPSTMHYSTRSTKANCSSHIATSSSFQTQWLFHISLFQKIEAVLLIVLSSLHHGEVPATSILKNIVWTIFTQTLTKSWPKHSSLLATLCFSCLKTRQLMR